MRIFASFLAILFTLSAAALPLRSAAQFEPCAPVAVTAAPPPLPVYTQPPAPAPNYMWNPGYWAWGSYGYYWVPGVWIPPPAVGLYWTPGYWGFSAGIGYAWNQGYWGPSVGFYGGINYGFGYFGAGFAGGFWAGNAFRYNTAFVNVNRTVIRNTYVDRRVINRNVYNRSRVSYNGGRGGISARPTAFQRAAAHRKRLDPTALQRTQARNAGQNRNNLVAFNHGRPPVAAVRTPIAAANRQPGFKPLTAADKTVAQRRALSTAHVSGATVARAGPARQAGSTPERARNQFSESRRAQPSHVQSPSRGRPSPPQRSAYRGAAPHGASHGGPPHGASHGGPPHGSGGGQHKPPHR